MPKRSQPLTGARGSETTAYTEPRPPGSGWTRGSLVLDAFLIAVLAALLVRPLFKAGYFDKWESIESTFIADARFLNDHWPHPRWQPLWYGGTRSDYVYPPALRYGTAVAARVSGLPPVRAYHGYVALFYCLGIAGVYLFARVAGGGRGAAWLAAAGTALVSPSFLFIPSIRADAWLWVPQRLGVLTRYGEGPHITALAWIPPALAFAWLALGGRRPWALAAAAVAGAVVVLHNFYGAVAFAVLFVILAWSIWLTSRDGRVWLRAAAVAVLTYGLTAFWLVPSYIALTSANMKFVAAPGNAGAVWILAAAFVVYALAGLKLARGRPGLAYPVFLAGGLLFFGFSVFGRYAADLRVVGEPHRWVPELDLLLVLAAVEALRRLWNRGGMALRAACAVAVLVSLGTSARYVAHAWKFYPLAPDYRERIEYRVQDWTSRNLPGARLMVGGSVRFWYDAWRDLSQIGGGSDQGVENRMVLPALWYIVRGADPRTSIDWLVALGVDTVVVSGSASEERYHDFQNPRMFAGLLPVLHDNGRGDTIYAVPRRWPGIARVVTAARLAALRPPGSAADGEAVRAYRAVVEEDAAAPATVEWHGTDAFTVRARTSAGQAITVQETWDPSWRAFAGGREISVGRDALGWMRIDAPPGDGEIRLKFSTPFENVAGRVLTALSLIVLLILARPTRSPAPAATPPTS